MKVYKFFKIPDENDRKNAHIEERYPLYAITNDKELAKRFKHDRNMKKFIYKKHTQVTREEYIEMCSKPQIKTQDCYWGDYSFQFWMVPEGDGYRADGAYGQITFIWPKYDLTLSFQRPEDDKLPRVIEILREEVLSKM